MTFRGLIPWRGRSQELLSRSDDPFLALQERVGRMFDDFFHDFQGGPVDLHREALRVDVDETDELVRVSAELPGVAPGDVDLAVEDGLLTIRGEKRASSDEESRGVHQSERSFGAFLRQVRLPAEVDAEKAEASFENGVLTVRLPKLPEERSRSRRIEVRSKG